MQQCCDDGGGVHTDLRRDRRHGERVGDIRLSGFAKDTLMEPLRGVIGAIEQISIGLGMKLAVNGHQRVQHRIHLHSTAGKRTSEASRHAAHSAAGLALYGFVHGQIYRPSQCHGPCGLMSI